MGPAPAAPARAAPGGRVPVTLVSGFLGSGKTTLIARVLESGPGAEMGVVVNEFGRIGLDHLLLAHLSEDIALLESGCLCCKLGDDLARTLTDLWRARERQGGRLAHVLIETSGLADPAPIIHSIMQDPVIAERFHFSQLLTVVDASLAGAQLEQYGESAKQVMLADRLLISKSDLVSRVRLEHELYSRLRALNPVAPCHVPSRDDAGGLLELLDAPAPGERGARDGRTRAPAGPAASPSHTAVSAESFSLVRPLVWAQFTEWLGALLHARSEDILRIKGVLNVEGRARPLMLHGIQHVFFPPREMPRWPQGDRCTRLVFISRHVAPGALERSLRDTLGASQ